mmetsp:Transcript_22011/g.32624  ORF Transcript_22011/g.32624 Transcript_22011/m.32624 type:complete len:143 (+) Transcript_22011:97-525(+)
MQAGSITLISVVDDAVNVNMRTVARGVLVTDACVAPIKQKTATGTKLDPITELHACTNGAAAKKRGKMIPPGNFPAHARAMEISFAIPTWTAADALSKGRDGLTLATLVSISDRPCLVAINAVFCPSTIICRLPSPQKSVCG